MPEPCAIWRYDIDPDGMTEYRLPEGARVVGVESDLGGDLFIHALVNPDRPPGPPRLFRPVRLDEPLPAEAAAWTLLGWADWPDADPLSDRLYVFEVPPAGPF